MPALLLMGPTAAGKSRVALALAREFDGEIVSVDSAQIYRGMNIGTAKPSAHERMQVPHHLIDVVDPTQAYSAAQFATDALERVADIRARGRLPILAGGTMLYFKVVAEGLSNLPPANATMRAALDAQAAREGWPALHARLSSVDPVTAVRLAPNDAQRIQRALEVFEIAGVPLSALQGQRRSTSEALGATLRVALIPADRAQLHAVIAQRFDQMLADGLVEELADLRRRFVLDPHLPAMRTVGYRQAWEFMDGQIDARALRERGIVATRQLAKRQLTWLRSTVAEAIDPATEDATERIAGWIRTRLGRNAR